VSASSTLLYGEVAVACTVGLNVTELLAFPDTTQPLGRAPIEVPLTWFVDEPACSKNTGSELANDFDFDSSSSIGFETGIKLPNKIATIAKTNIPRVRMVLGCDQG
jgi:hypothetical protein